MKQLALALIALSFAGTAFAQKDRCADVLSNGTFATQIYKSDTNYQRLVDTHLATMTYQEAKSDRKITGNIPIGDIVLGVGFNESKFDSFKATSQFDQMTRVDFSNRTSVALQTGDAYILKAWSDCMKSRGGFSAVFESVNATTATLVLEWFAIAGIPAVRVDPNFVLPRGVTITSGMQYLRATNGQPPEEIVAGSPARIQFRLDTPTTPVAMDLNLLRSAGSDSAYLPPRMRKVTEKRAFPFESSSCYRQPTLILDALHNTGTESVVYTFCSHASDGWSFSQDPADWSATPSIQQGSDNGRHLAIFHVSNFVSFDRFQAKLGCSSSSGTDIRCYGNVALTEARSKWVPVPPQ